MPSVPAVNTMQPVDPAARPITRDESLWEDEVARVLAGAPAFGPAARAMLARVLTSLIVDASTDPASRRDARTMLRTVEAGLGVG